jgi:hypothetical protein
LRAKIAARSLQNRPKQAGSGHRREPGRSIPQRCAVPVAEPRPDGRDCLLIMDSADDISAIIFASLAYLSEPADGDAMRASMARGIKHMSVYRILELRQRILSELDEEIPVVRETLQMLDGQLILREIAGGSNWR